MRFSKQGFSLVEVVVAMAMVSLLGASFVGFTGYYSQSSRLNSQRDESIKIKEAMNGYFSDANFCSSNLNIAKGLKISSIESGLSLSSLKVNGEKIKEKLGASQGVSINSILLRPLNNRPQSAFISSHRYMGEVVFTMSFSEKTGGTHDLRIPIALDIEDDTVIGCRFFPEGVGPVSFTSCKKDQFITAVSADGKLKCIDYPTTTCGKDEKIVGIKKTGGGICKSFVK